MTTNAHTQAIRDGRETWQAKDGTVYLTPLGEEKRAERVFWQMVADAIRARNQGKIGEFVYGNRGGYNLG